jgi:DNA-binding NtrC family response regulator
MQDETADDPQIAPPSDLARRPPPLVLVVMSPTGAGSVQVPVQGVLVIGRSADCDVCVEDARLSRRHAELRCGATIVLVDLGSRNGTSVRGERVPANAPVPVRVGDAIAIGGTLLTLQRASGGERLRHVWSHGYFEARLEEECARASKRGSPFAILRVHVEGESAPPLDELDGADMLASYASGEYEALFTGMSASEADARAAAIGARFAGSGWRAAVAAYPRDGRTPEALIEHTTRALVRATPEAALMTQGAIDRMDAVIRRVAAGAINVLVLGETGVGKDVLARRIHELSPRAKMPLVAINCGALSETLLESELFGHEKGAFTGAMQAKQGLLESASGGAVFLDEVGEMPHPIQVKLLRVLDQREVMRVGAVRPRTIDVRFIAATNRDLEAEVAGGRFRRDLYFRLNGVSLSLPPLRERREEIGPLARTFLEDACRAMGRDDRPQIAADAMEAMRQYQWPGNIRELRNVIERAILLCTGDRITREHLPLEKMRTVFAEPGPSSTRLAPPPIPNSAQGHRTTMPPEAPEEGTPDERQRIIEALDGCAGNQSLAAKRLGISRATLIRRIEEYAIPRPRKGS